MHVHIGVADFLIVAAYLLILGFFLRTLAARYADTPFGEALAFIY